MELQIGLNVSDVSLNILKNKEAIDFINSKYYHDLSVVLITSIDKLLKKNKLDLKAIKSYKILSDLGQDSSSYKIASAFIQGLKI